MRGMSDMDSILKKQQECTHFALKMCDEKDPDKILEMAATFQKKAAELEKMAKAFEAAVLANAPKGTGKETVVILTPDQRARITEQTGVGLETVTLRDTGEKMWSKEIAYAEPAEIEKEAIRQAAETVLTIETKKQVEKIIKQLEAV